MKGKILKQKNTANPKDNLCDPVKFEEKAIGEFVLKLYHESCIQPNGFILKTTARKKFVEYVKANNYHIQFVGSNIGTLFQEHKFLLNCPKKSKTYIISLPKIREICRDNNQKEKVLPAGHVGNFLLTLLHGGQIQKCGLILKSRLQNEFQEYLAKIQCRFETYSSDIGTLLYKNKYLRHTPRGSEYYCIIMKTLYGFRNDKINELDALRLNINIKSTENDLLSSEGEQNDKLIHTKEIEVLPDAKEYPLVYEGGCKQNIIPNFALSSMGCYICQKNFKNPSHFDDHIRMHGCETDFEYLSSCDKNQKNIFTIIYQLCHQSHHFNFTMKTMEKDIIVERIIIVKTSLMYYAQSNKVPYEMPTVGIDSFAVDSHLFTNGIEQPIVVVYRYKFDKTTRFVEQHHFLRTEEFPTVHFNVVSSRVPCHDVLVTKIKLKEFYPETAMICAQKKKFDDESLCKANVMVGPYLEQKCINSQNVFYVWNTLLQIEDLEGMKGYAAFQQNNASIKRFGSEYSVKFRTLPKNTTLESTVGPLDEILLIDESKSDPKTHFAIIERVYHNQICFTYKESVICELKKYKIIVRPSRLCLRYQYRAMCLLRYHVTKDYLYPTCSNTRKNVSTLNLELFNPQIAENAEQLQAVKNIADELTEFAPYIIFGPPGTGKTTTIVEAVLQLWKLKPNSRILITSGSNAACNEVAIRLCQVLMDIDPANSNILRIFAKSNESRLDSIDDLLIECSNFYRDHFYPGVKIIRQYRIVVCTLAVVGRLVSGAIGEGFFTHIFIDECAASTEPEALVGFIGTSSKKTKLILSGDHKQLGPILRSERAGKLGLNISLMERLLKLRCYDVDLNGSYDRSIQTRLVQNFRSHPEIVGLYNQLYYNGELQPKAKIDDSFWTMKWHMLPNKNFPIIFHSVYGNSRKDSCKSVSLCNEREVAAVMDYVKDLMFFGINEREITEKDIGIISPYKKQYLRIQEEINIRGWHQIEVGPVETFQGKEKEIIIVSTVRSFTKSLGFLNNPRRLNVILSRAKSLLVMIGNPETLSQNNDFKFIIDKCREANSMMGGLRSEDNKTKGNISMASSTEKLTDSSQELSAKLSNMTISSAQNKTEDKKRNVLKKDAPNNKPSVQTYNSNNGKSINKISTLVLPSSTPVVHTAVRINGEKTLKDVSNEVKETAKLIRNINEGVTQYISIGSSDNKSNPHQISQHTAVQTERVLIREANYRDTVENTKKWMQLSKNQISQLNNTHFDCSSTAELLSISKSNNVANLLRGEQTHEKKHKERPLCSHM